jgi:hypothetical protein
MRCENREFLHHGSVVYGNMLVSAQAWRSGLSVKVFGERLAALRRQLGH